MADVRWGIDLSGLSEKLARFQDMQDRAANLTPVWDVGNEMFTDEVDAHFRTQGRHLLGYQWRRLSDAYARRKPAVPAPFGILYLTGRLHESLTDKAHPEHLAVYMPREAIYGTTVEYAQYHQTGTEYLPPRPIVVLTPRMKAFFVRACLNWILRGRQHAGHTGVRRPQPERRMPSDEFWQRVDREA